MELFHHPIVFHDDSQSATSPDVFQILKEYPMDRDKNIMRENMSLFESRKFLNEKIFSNEETLQIYKYWYRHDCVLEKTAVDLDAS